MRIRPSSDCMRLAWGCMVAAEPGESATAQPPHALETDLRSAPAARVRTAAWPPFALGCQVLRLTLPLAPRACMSAASERDRRQSTLLSRSAQLVPSRKSTQSSAPMMSSSSDHSSHSSSSSSSSSSRLAAAAAVSSLPAPLVFGAVASTLATVGCASATASSASSKRLSSARGGDIKAGASRRRVRASKILATRRSTESAGRRPRVRVVQRITAWHRTTVPH